MLDLGLPGRTAQVPGVVLAPAVGTAGFGWLLGLVLLEAVTSVMGTTANPTPGRERAAPLVVAPPLTPVTPKWLWDEGPDGKATPGAQINVFRNLSLKEHRDLFGLYSCPGFHLHWLVDFLQSG